MAAKNRSILTQERLKELLHYDPSTGIFTWLLNKGRAKAGSIPSCLDGKGYPVVKIDQHIYRLHRLAWLYCYGFWPIDQLDHVNRVRTDNRISNLRECSNSENSQNLKMIATNKSGYTGVSWHKASKKWRSVIILNKKQYHLGTFKNPIDAHAAYCVAKLRLHKFQSVLTTGGAG